MSIFLVYFLFLLGVFLFSFILFQKLREDYTNNQIYSYTLFSVIFTLLGLWAANTWTDQFANIISLIFFILSSAVLLKYLNIKFFEFIDAVSLAVLYFYLFFKLGSLIQYLSSFGVDFQSFFFQRNIAEVVFIVFGIYSYKFFLKNYRQFTWYPSGKIGFTGLMTSFSFFLFMALVLFTTHFQSPDIILKLPYLSLTYQLVNAVISLLISITSLFVVYFRSGRR